MSIRSSTHNEHLNVDKVIPSFYQASDALYCLFNEYFASEGAAPLITLPRFSLNLKKLLYVK